MALDGSVFYNDRDIVKDIIYGDIAIDTIDDISLWSEEKGLLNEKYKDFDIDIKALAKELSSNEVAENLDNDIECVISLVLTMKKEVKTAHRVKKYIRAYLLETEIKGNE